MQSDIAHLRWLSSDATAEQLARWYLVLNAAERARADRFRFAADRNAFVAAHALLRAMLSDQIGCATVDLQFVGGPHGKPALATRPDVQFNLSHTHGWVACAIASDPVGIDVERVDRDAAGDVVEMFSPSEVRYLRARSLETRAADFTRLWTLKEAVVKATGEGLHRSLASFSVALDPVQIEFRNPRDPAAHGHWHFAEIAPAHDRRLALAVFARDASPIAVDARPAHPNELAPQRSAA